MSDDTREDKVTTVEAETEFKGTLTSKHSVLVRGTIDGQLNAPQLTVTETGVVVGQINARELRSRGVLQGHLTGETMYISGTVRDNTVIRAHSLEVNPERLTDPLHVVFGNCVLEVGDDPAVIVPEPHARVTVRPASADVLSASSSDPATPRAPGAASDPRESAAEPLTVPA
jgi:cytoskeletal protein CcmA (bactofilin family)